MKQSQYDPTLKEHFTEAEARRYIHHLKNVIASLENKLRISGEKNAMFADKHTQTKRKLKRLITHLEYLQEQYPNIDFGVNAFKEKHDLEK